MSSEGDMSRRDELEALLPFYLNGTLSGEELAAVEAWLASGPDAMAALAAAEAELSAAVDANEAIRPPADALSRLTRTLDREAGRERSTSGASWFARAWQSVAGLPAGLAWGAAAVALALLILQTATGVGLRGPGYEIAGADAELYAGPFALVTFKPEARMADIATFLSDNGAVVIGGPSAGGVFRIAVPVKTVAEYERVFGLIAAQPFVEKAMVGRKPKDGE
jgi:hypothetical protein